MRRVFLVLLCGLVVAPAAFGNVVEGNRWPGPTISVWNGTKYKAQVINAMRSWNAAGAKITFVPASSKDTADVAVRYGAAGEQGLAVVGYEPGSTITLARGLGRIVSTTLAAHELGHVLGLGHKTRGCTVMAPVVRAGSRSRCGIGACKALWRCLVQPDDANGAIALYGRRNAR